MSKRTLVWVQPEGPNPSSAPLHISFVRISCHIFTAPSFQKAQKQTLKMQTIVDIWALKPIQLQPIILLKLRVDWLKLFMGWFEPLCLIPIYRARTVHKLWSFFERTLNRQLEDSSEQNNEFDGKCIGLESWIVPLTKEYSGSRLSYSTTRGAPIMNCSQNDFALKVTSNMATGSELYFTLWGLMSLVRWSWHFLCARRCQGSPNCSSLTP